MESLRECIRFEEFEEACRYVRRFALGNPARRYLEALLKSADDRLLNLDTSFSLYRTQAGCRHLLDGVCDEEGTPFELEVAHSASRMKPLDRRGRQGRANPQGIPVLYLATDEATAVAEIRPFKGETVSVGQFSLKKLVRLVDCAREHTTTALGIAFREELRGRSTETEWAKIDRAFKEPVRGDETEAEYAPTQILAEHFKAAGFDGVHYKSALGPGFNLALFDPELADMVDGWVVRVREIAYTFEQSPILGCWSPGELAG